MTKRNTVVAKKKVAFANLTVAWSGIEELMSGYTHIKPFFLQASALMDQSSEC